MFPGIPSTDGTISVDVLAAMAQILPALLAVGLLVPIVGRMRMQTPERLYFASQVVSVLLAEGAAIFLLLEGDPVTGGWRMLFWGASLYSLVGIFVLALSWARPTREERAAEQAAYEEWEAARKSAAPDRKRSHGRSKKSRRD